MRSLPVFNTNNGKSYIAAALPIHCAVRIKMSTRQSRIIQLRRPRDPQELRRRHAHILTSPTETPIPFRWDISHPEKLGSILTNGTEAYTTPPPSHYRAIYPGFLEALLVCAARTLALAGDADLVFVGRAPESLFDLLSGLLAGTSWQHAPDQRLTLLRFSIGDPETADLHRLPPQRVTALRVYMDSIGLSPAKILVRKRPVALTDLICNGTTMHQLLLFIEKWTLEEKRDWPAIRRKLRVVGIMNRHDENPPRPRWRRRRDGYTTYWPWHDEAEWKTELLERGALREVAISSELWDFLGNWQVKTTPSYSPEEWGTEEASRPDHALYYLVALRAARQLYEAGCQEHTRQRFAECLATEDTGMQNAWCRRLVREIRKR